MDIEELEYLESLNNLRADNNLYKQRLQYSMESSRDWRVEDKLIILMSKINHSRLKRSCYIFIKRKNLRVMVYKKMKELGCGAIDAITELIKEADKL